MINFIEPSFFTDFAVTATRNGTLQVAGIFDKTHADAFDLICGNDPVFRCPDSAGVVRGDTLLISATTYTVTHTEPDGTGLTVCRLEAA